MKSASIKYNYNVKSYIDNDYTILIIKFTDKCNMSCKYCYSPEVSQSIHDNIHQLLYKTIEDIYNLKNGYIILNILGGEVFLFKDELYQLIKQINLSNFRDKVDIRIQSNGTLILEEDIEILQKYKVGLGISLDGFNDFNNMHRVMNNDRSSLKKVLDIMLLLETKNFCYGLQFVMHKNNAKDITQILNEVSQRNIKNISCNLMIPNEITKDYVLGRNDAIQVYKDIITFEMEKPNIRFRERNIAIWTTQILNKMSTEDFACYSSFCKKGDKIFTISCDGNIYPCDWLMQDEYYIGNIKRNSITEIIGTNLDFKNEFCNDCEWVYSCNNFCKGKFVLEKKHIGEPLTCYVSASIKEYLLTLMRNDIDISVLL